MPSHAKREAARERRRLLELRKARRARAAEEKKAEREGRSPDYSKDGLPAPLDWGRIMRNIDNAAAAAAGPSNANANGLGNGNERTTSTTATTTTTTTPMTLGTGSSLNPQNQNSANEHEANLPTDTTSKGINNPLAQFVNMDTTTTNKMDTINDMDTTNNMNTTTTNTKDNNKALPPPADGPPSAQALIDGHFRAAGLSATTTLGVARFPAPTQALDSLYPLSSGATRLTPADERKYKWTRPETIDWPLDASTTHLRVLAVMPWPTAVYLPTGLRNIPVVVLRMPDQPDLPFATPALAAAKGEEMRVAAITRLPTGWVMPALTPGMLTAGSALLTRVLAILACADFNAKGQGLAKQQTRFHRALWGEIASIAAQQQQQLVAGAPAAGKKTVRDAVNGVDLLVAFGATEKVRRTWRDVLAVTRATWFRQLADASQEAFLRWFVELGDACRRQRMGGLPPPVRRRALWVLEEQQAPVQAVNVAQAAEEETPKMTTAMEKLGFTKEVVERWQMDQAQEGQQAAQMLGEARVDRKGKGKAVVQPDPEPEFDEDEDEGFEED